MKVIFFIALFASVCFAETPRDVNLKTSDGTVLRGSFFDARKPGPGIILLHQCNRERHAWSELALQLSQKGFHVLTLDYRGFGESDGTIHNSLPPQERQLLMKEKWRGDIDAALQYLVSQPGVDKNRIGAGGASCGVNQAIQLARRNSVIKSLVLLSGNTDEDGIRYIRESSWLPIFAAAADDDRGAVETMQWITGFSRNPRNKFVHYVSGGHGADLFPFQRNLIPAIVEWFSSTLKSAQEKIPANVAKLPPTPQEEFWSVLHQPGGSSRALQLFQEGRKKDPNAFGFPEAQVNALGYEKLQAGNTDEAIRIFKLNIAAYPNSANVYDSLADAYVAAGQSDEARKFAQKAIDTLAQDQQTPEAFKTQLRESAMQKLNAPPQNAPPVDMTKLPIVLKVTGTDNPIIRKNVVYKSVDRTDLKMDLYLPEAKRAPVVFLISGAGND
jgi:dienelactone hydrolase